MKILVLANTLKGSLKANEIRQIAKKFDSLIISDGGDGFLDTILQIYPKAKKNFRKNS